MSASVPVARREALADCRRLVASAIGVGLALMLILLLGGLWSGVRAQVTRYENATGAQLAVLAPGTRSLFAEGSRVPESVVSQVRQTPGVRWATPLRTQYVILDLHMHKVAASLIGANVNTHGGPLAFSSGRAPTAAGEAAVDRVLAARHGIKVGDTLTVLGRPLRVVGLTSGTASFMTGYVFVTYDTAGKLLGTRDATAILVGTNNPAAVGTTLRAEGLNAVSTAELRATALSIATRVYGTPLKLMVAVAFLVGTLIIALAAYNAVTERRREYGIVKAIGATSRRLVSLALRETAIIGLLGLVSGLVLFVVGRATIVWLRPQFSVVLTPSAVAQAIIAAAAMVVLGATVPAWRLAKLDPAVAYRSA
jgi:putative ABC transport system permease protein